MPDIKTNVNQPPHTSPALKSSNRPQQRTPPSQAKIKHTQAPQEQLQVHQGKQGRAQTPNPQTELMFADLEPYHELSIDKTFLLRLAEAPEQEIKNWYQSHPEQHNLIRDAFNAVFEQSTPAEQTQLESLGIKLQKLQDLPNTESARQHYAQSSANEIAREFISKAAEDRYAGGSERVANSIAEDLRLLAFVKTGGRSLEEKVYQALSKALDHQQSNGVRSLPAFQLAEAIAELQGPGSAEVKAQFIKIALEKDNLVVDSNPRDKASVRGGIIEKLLQSDPIGVVRKLEALSDHDSDKNALLLSRSLEAIIKRYPGKPDLAADALGEILGKATREYADSFLESKPDQKKINELSHSMGYLLRASETTVDKLAQIEKGKIDKGALILRVFSKGVSTLSGVKGIDKLAAKGIDFQAKREKVEVEHWQKGIVSSYRTLMNHIFMAHEPAAASADEGTQDFEARQNLFETELKRGYNNHIDDESGNHKRTFR